MICQRCGNCCFSMFVVIREGDRYRAKPGQILCPYLTWEGTKATCLVHEEPWYKDTPCHTYGNSKIDPDFYCKAGKPCRIGLSFQQQGGLVKLRGPIEKANMQDLEVLEP